MKRSYMLLLVLLLGFARQSQAQGIAANSKLLRFYENLAERDAAYEQGFKLDQQDELDYWNDQENFERELGKSNFSFYLVYMKSKKEAHREYLKACKGSCAHSDIYWSKMRNYLSVPDASEFFKTNSEKVVQSNTLKQ
ncbi:MAG: hypothetical protein AAGA43_07350 [Bacteroidota bacterium]